MVRTSASAGSEPVDTSTGPSSCAGASVVMSAGSLSRRGRGGGGRFGDDPDHGRIWIGLVANLQVERAEPDEGDDQTDRRFPKARPRGHLAPGRMSGGTMPAAESA